MMRRVLLGIVMIGSLWLADGPGFAATSVDPSVHLKAITSRVSSKGASLVVEATEPVPYVTMRPDPLTIVLEFRNVDVEGIANHFRQDAKSPIARVAVEKAIEKTDAIGIPVSRVRISLTEAVAHRVRSERNTVVVDLDKPTASAASATSATAVDPIDALGLGKTPAPTPVSVIEPAQSASTRQATAPTPPAASAQPGAAAAQGAPETLGPTREPRKYNGNPVSMEFDNADLRAVLTTFSDISGLNMVVDPAVQGTVTVRLTDVPWDQALDIILRANKLGYIVDGTVVRIAPLGVLADEESQRRKLADEQALAGDLRVFTKQLSYAKAEELQPLLTKSALSLRGTVQVDPRTNTLIITDLADRLQTASDLIATLDRAQPQVEIEARIVQTTKNYARALGVQWGFTGRADAAIGNTTNLAFPNTVNAGGRLGAQGPAASGTAVNLPVGAATSGVGLALGSVNGAFNLDVALSALEQSGNGRILSTPRVSTLNNVEAEVTQGIQIPLQTIANNTVTVTFKDAALTLKVMPQITAADTVIMRVAVENATPDFSRAAGPAAIPPINTQRAITTLLVSDGQTTVIGGIYTSNQQTQSDRTPGIGQIPLLNWLFKRDRVDDASTELLIFITPRIIKG